MRRNRQNMQTTKLLLASFLVLMGAQRAFAAIQVAGTPVELAIHQISERTARIQLLPLDEAGRVRAGPPSTVLASFDSTQKLRVREFKASTEVQIGAMRIVVKAEPLSFVILNSDGKTLQEIVFDTGDGSFTFHTDAPVFGLGEGQKQFDRRGSRYPMINGQIGPFLATHGGTIPVPLLIGIDGWAMFVNGP